MPVPTRVIGEPLQTERMTTGQRRLLRDLVVEVERDKITVPAGTVTDFSSIPWFGRILVRWSKVDIAGVVHDWLYQAGTTSRARADEIWRLVAIAGKHHASAFQAWVGWVALRAGGWLDWYRRRRQDAEDANSTEGGEAR
jgi:hypothetical protein